MLSIVPETEEPTSLNEGRHKSLLNLRLVRGPLPDHSNRLIIDEYNRQTNSDIPLPEFLHWTQASPVGPALHGLLETEDGKLVGHQCLLPMRARVAGREIVYAKSEYTFLAEEHRSTKIIGHEKSQRPTHLIASRLLLEQGESLGWDPILISTLPFLFRWARTVGSTAVQVPVYECLLILKPWDAATKTLNLANWQRAALGVTGTAQSLVWKPTLLVAGRSTPLRSIPMDEEFPLPKSLSTLSFFHDSESLRWRYFTKQYQRVGVGSNPDDQLILKSGSQDGYLRVCQWNLSSEKPRLSLLLSLAYLASEQNAFGLRWAIYGTDESAREMVSRMRQLGFLCARRVRTLLIRSKDPRFLEAANWDLSDAMFSFHH